MPASKNVYINPFLILYINPGANNSKIWELPIIQNWGKTRYLIFVILINLGINKLLINNFLIDKFSQRFPHWRLKNTDTIFSSRVQLLLVSLLTFSFLYLQNYLLGPRPWPEESYEIGSTRLSFRPSVRKFSQNWLVFSWNLAWC